MAASSGPRAAYYHALRRTWSPDDVVELDLSLPLTVRRPHPKVRSQRGRVALTRGPLVYCLESVDNPELDIFAARLDLDSIRVNRPRRYSETSEVYLNSGFEGIQPLQGQTRDGQPVTAIPCAYWGSRGKPQRSVMTGIGTIYTREILRKGDPDPPGRDARALAGL